MTTFLGIENIGRKEKEYVAILIDPSEPFRIGERRKARIQNLTMLDMDTSDEQKALKALEEVKE